MGNVQIRIVRADGTQFAKAEVVEYRNDCLGWEAMVFKASRFTDQVDERQVCIGAWN
jgi:hypothetical protein